MFKFRLFEFCPLHSYSNKLYKNLKTFQTLNKSPLTSLRFSLLVKPKVMIRLTMTIAKFVDNFLMAVKITNTHVKKNRND